MSFFVRIANLWKGFLSLFVGSIEEKHPEIAYENAINAMTEKFAKLKSATAGLVKHRTQLEVRISKHESELEEITLQVQVAVNANDDESAMVLLEKQGELEKALQEDRKELEQAGKDAETAKESLRAVAGEIDKLKRERDKVIAQIHDAQARIQIQEQLDGLSVDEEVKALQNVRDFAEKVKAEVKVGDELKESSLDSKLAKIKAQTGNLKAAQQLAALKAAKAGASATATATATQGSGGGDASGGGKSL